MSASSKSAARNAISSSDLQRKYLRSVLHPLLFEHHFSPFPFYEYVTIVAGHEGGFAMTAAGCSGLAAAATGWFEEAAIPANVGLSPAGLFRVLKEAVAGVAAPAEWLPVVTTTGSLEQLAAGGATFGLIAFSKRSRSKGNAAIGSHSGISLKNCK